MYRIRQVNKRWLFMVLLLGLFLSACGGAGEEEQAEPTEAVAGATEASATNTPEPAGPQPVVISGAGDVTATLDEFRQALGGSNNAGAPGPFSAGFREINWDGVPDDLASPNFMPSDFFNAPTEPRARGAFFTTPGEGVQASADSDNSTGTAVRFGHINPTYTDIFTTFSEERLFSPIGSNVVDLTFFVPGTTTPAVVNGFGAVYTDVDTEHTAFEYFDADGNSLGQFETPIADNGLSFLGVVFPEPIVAKVQIKYGTDALGPDDGNGIDVAVMDDFIYGEPQAISGAVAAPAPTATTEATAVPNITLLTQFRNVDDQRLAGVSLDLAGLEAAPAGKSYAVWLVDDAGQYRLLGEAVGGQVFEYASPEGENLVGLYSGAALSLEAPANIAAGALAAPTDLLFSGEIPAEIVPDVRQLAVSAPDTPEGVPYDPALNEQAELVSQHSQLSLDSIAAGDHAVARVHAEHVINILVGADSEDFGDLNGDGAAQNPGDGYGIWPYAFRIGEIAAQIAENQTLPQDIAQAAGGIVVCASNISDTWGPEAVGYSREILDSADALAAEGPGLELKDAANAIATGVDANGNGQIEIAAGECGARQIYELSHDLFDIRMTSVGAPPVSGGGGGAGPAPTALPVAFLVSMKDFEFAPLEILIKVGTTITWLNDGAAPHSATAVDGSFDTAVFDPGGEASITFNTAGTFAYYCLLHGTPDGTGGMVGTVIVEP
jgi:plastocyanin